MRTRRLGNSGLEVSTLCLGAMTFGEADEKSFMHKVGADEPTSFAMMDRAREAGVNFLDTADVYGQDGLSERVVGRWLKERGVRDEIVLATKFRFVMRPGPNGRGAARIHIREACEASLRRLGVDYLDVYLLHWPGRHPLAETLEAFITLREKGFIRAWGISNFDLEGLGRWQKSESAAGVGDACATNQIYYALSARNSEFDLLPTMKAQSMPLMAYSPLGSGQLMRDAKLRSIAEKHGLSPAQMAIAWTMRDPNVISIPKSVRPDRIEENFKASQITLSAQANADLDAAFPPPSRKMPLAML